MAGRIGRAYGLCATIQFEINSKILKKDLRGCGRSFFKPFLRTILILPVMNLYFPGDFCLRSRHLLFFLFLLKTNKTITTPAAATTVPTASAQFPDEAI
jgi:hypothetical protein